MRVSQSVQPSPVYLDRMYFAFVVESSLLIDLLVSTLV